MVLGIQALGIVFGLFLLYFTFLHYKRKEFGAGELVFWSSIWVLFVYLVLFPYTLSYLAQSLNLVRVMDLLTIAGIMFLVVLTFYGYMMNVHSRRKLEQVVRALALRRKK
ncbi:DUF2304 domain-containing protein [Candidatus Woesearchaeota archaeon]|nr:DUF2304 domain-containing protein [Candidatus Woesearchaeota archaeon]